MHNALVAAKRVSDVVTWQIQPPTMVVRSMNLVVDLINVALSAANHMPADALQGSPRTPQDLDEQVALEPVFIAGTALWMPAAWTGEQLVTMTQRGATIDPTGMATRAIPLQELRLVHGTTRSRSRRPKHARAAWALAVSDGKHDLSVTGPWLSLAWMGHLAGWPEP